MLGVVFNRLNVVLLAMDLKGPMPQNQPATYSPTVFEWGISVGLIAATIFLFRLGARLLPILVILGSLLDFLFRDKISALLNFRDSFCNSEGVQDFRRRLVHSQRLMASIAPLHNSHAI
jgi:hypothetical protein